VPRASEPPLVEHRARQLRCLLDAARALVAEEGPDALSLAALARRVGLSRPGLYEYFRSRDDLAAAIVEDEFPRRTEAVAAAVSAARDLPDKVAAYIRVQLEVTRDGRLPASLALAEHALAEDARARILDGHAQMLRPLVAALADAGLAQPGLRAELIHGVVDASARALGRSGVPPDEVIETAVAQAVCGVTPAHHGRPLPAAPLTVTEPA
jgi:AcrR family transcriptional regulator